jgi:hypothetical protein
VSDFLGIAREEVFSPGKVDADRLILEAVADVLRGRGHVVRTVDTDRPLPEPGPATVVFTMSQGARVLDVLRTWERRGIRVVNPVDGILATHRCRMTERLAVAGVPTPETLVVRTDAGWPEWLEDDGGWLKRGDVHATEPGDVLRVRGQAEASRALTELRARGIGAAVLQRHVPGTVLKFYGVVDDFVSWAPHAGEGVVARGLPGLAQAAARALGLEVYGGDCVVDARGALWLIDVNDWPSFAPCRAAGAEAIARRLEALLEPMHA